MALTDDKLYTIRGPIADLQKRGLPTRAMQNWMDQVDERLRELLFQQSLIITDVDLTATGHLNNRVLTDKADVLRFENTVPVFLTGLIAKRTSQRVLIISAGTADVHIEDEDSLSDPENRFLTGVRSVRTLASNVGTAEVFYDGDDSRWRFMTHNQGAAITVPYDPLNFTADLLGSPDDANDGTWTVELADVLTHAYYLQGSLLHITLRLLDTDVVQPAERLHIALPQAYTAKKHVSGVIFFRTEPSPGSGQHGLLQVAPSATHMDIEAFNTTTGFIGSTDVLGQFWMEIGSGGVPSTGTGGGGGGGAGGGPFPPFPPTFPDQFALIQSLATANPMEIAQSCIQTGGNWDFMDRAVAALQATDSRWGWNGKRGDIADPSTDAVSFFWGAGAPTDGSNEVYVIDIISAQCGAGANPQASFADVTDYSGVTLGAYITNRP